MPKVPYNSLAFDNGSQLASLLGTFWSVWCGDRDFVENMMTSAGSEYFQTYLDTLDLVATKSRFNVPVFKRKYWSTLTALESEKGTYTGLSYQYGDGSLTYSTSKYPSYGDSKQTVYYAFPIDADLKSVSGVYNRVVNPSLAWASGVDFIIDTERSLILFLEDPFSNDLIPKIEIRDENGEVTDRQFLLWLNMSEWDHEYVYEQFGYALGIWMESSSFYREFISALWDSLVLGPTRSALKLILSAISGVPFAQDNETVTEIVNQSHATFVATDVNVYEFQPTVQLTVAAGDTLTPGQAMCTAVEILEPGNDTDWSSVAGIALGASLTGRQPSLHPITIENRTVDVVLAGYDPEGRAIVRFDVSGFPTDVESFWTEAHAAGVALGKTAAHLLDIRTVAVGEPLARDLPATVNPFTFFMDNLFDNNLYVLRLRPADFADGVPGLAALEYLHEYASPYTTYIIFVEMDPEIDYHDVSATDTISLYKGAYNEDTAIDFATDRGPTIRSIRSCR